MNTKDDWRMTKNDDDEELIGWFSIPSKKKSSEAHTNASPIPIAIIAIIAIPITAPFLETPNDCTSITDPTRSNSCIKIQYNTIQYIHSPTSLESNDIVNSK
jgi:hypothetical protein